MSRPKLDLPLRDHNSPRSQWISNISLLKNQLRDGELVDSNTDLGTKLSWNELEAKLSKRMKDPSVVLSSSTTLPQKSPKNKHNGYSPMSPNNLNLIRHPNHRSKQVPSSSQSIASWQRPTLKFPMPEKSKEVLKQVQVAKPRTHILPPDHLSPSPTKTTKGTVERGITLAFPTTPTKPILPQTESALDESSNKFQVGVSPAQIPSSDKRIPEVTSIVRAHESRQPSATPASKPLNDLPPKIKADRPTEMSEDRVFRSADMKGQSDVPIVTSPEFVASSAASASVAIQSIASFALPNRKPRRERKPKGSLSWLRRALKSHDAAPKETASRVPHVASSCNVSVKEDKTIDDTLQTMSTEQYFKPTTPLQLGLWLTEIRKAIRLASHEQHRKSISPRNIVDSTPDSPRSTEELKEDEKDDNDAEDLYYKKNRDVGAYVDYSTFDDGDSVSSLELLFKWLTCRDLNDTDHKRNEGPMTPPGTVMATESNVSDDISIDLDVRPTRRTLFAR
jgi:hypothetical protein